MIREMKLKGQVRLNMDNTLTFLSTLYDGTPFEVAPTMFDVQMNEEFIPGKYVVDGWLYVVQEAQQDDRCYLTLPKPSIVFGRQVTVKDWQLMSRTATIADFKPRKMTSPATQVPHSPELANLLIDASQSSKT